MFYRIFKNIFINLKYKGAEYIMLIDNLDKIIGLFGLMIGIEIIAAVIFSISVLYFRSPIIAGTVGNLSSLGMTLGLIGFSIYQERKKIVV
jgi:hypothetical protein